ncbi:MAG TPA: diadenylate cyclase CdaA [Bacteroidales bacterium]|nr:diadenylate cyclase CdaA [Bacteroidales bacterium]HPF03886.1 diadenylate cyclase CdaA [Bacteroidales bacterium]HPJ58397.1 diadenylate cyclase CdaA [Bacteroidales bacterium]HPR10797.1 diadenylate cyclase CdaA [Bacteroidales bacterium]HRW85980.1 diadenylate cyclase CdaA [Bacteroidales bacterium]
MIVPITVLDIIDILLVAFIFYQLYRIIKGTAALSIFIAIFLIYLFWLLVKALNMELVSSIIGQVTGVGVIALIVVFQQEVRRFLLMLGNRYMRNTRFTLKRFFSNLDENILAPAVVEELVEAAVSMSGKRIGALIVIGRQTRLAAYTEEGQIIKAQISAELLETLFFKNNPLHDGAVLIEDGLILAARCPLPVTDQFKLPSNLGMRHRAAIGMSEHTDAIVVVVSEETGRISYSESGILREGLKPNELRNLLLAEKVW